LATILFERVAHADAKHKAETLTTIFRSKLYPQGIKMESSLKLALLYAKNQNYKNAINWIVTFFKIATPAQQRQMRNYIFPLVSNLFLQGKFQTAQKVARTLADRCHIFTSQQQNSLIQISKDITLLTQQAAISPQKAITLFHQKSCRLKPQLQNIIKIDLYNYNLINHHIGTALQWAQQIDPKIITDLYQKEVEYIWEQKIFNPNQLTLSNLKPFISYIPKENITKVRKQLHQFDLTKTNLSVFNKQAINIPVPFNENRFDRALESYLTTTSTIAQKIEQALPQLPTKLAIIITMQLQEVYRSQADYLRAITFPSLEKNYQKGLKQVLRQIAYGFTKKKREISKIQQKTVKRSNLQHFVTRVKKPIDLTPLELIDQTTIHLSYDNLKGGR
jgi:hypothetical protein